MAKFVAYEGIKSYNGIELTGSLNMSGSLVMDGTMDFSQTYIDPLTLNYLSNTNWYNGGQQVLALDNGVLSYSLQSNLFWGGNINYLNNGTNIVSTTGNYTFNQWNGTTQVLYITNASQELFFDLSNNYQRDFYCTLIITQTNLLSLTTRAIWSGGAAWTTSIVGSRSTTNYNFADVENTMTSNIKYTCTQSPDSTSLVSVAIDYSARKFYFHCTNWS